MARRLGIHHREALRRLEFQDAVVAVLDEIEGLLGDRGGGIWFDDVGRLKIGVVRRGGEIAGAIPTQVTDVLAAHGLSDQTDFVPVDYSQRQLLDALPAITSELIDLYRAGKISSGLDSEPNALHVDLAVTVTAAERARIERVAERAPVRVLLRQTTRATIFAAEE
jgi:hypothetical protein